MSYRSYQHSKTISDQKNNSFSGLFSVRGGWKEVSVSLHVKTCDTSEKRKLNTEDLTKQTSKIHPLSRMFFTKSFES